MKLSPMKKSMIAALCAALCVALPLALSLLPGMDGAYGALHMPVLLCAFVCGSGSGLLCALVGVCLSAIITGVPTLVFLPVIMVECMLGAAVTGLVRALCGFKRPGREAVLSFAAGMIIGRLGGALCSAALFGLDNTGFFVWIAAYFVSAMPGMIIQLVLLPVFVNALADSGLVFHDS